MMRLALLFTTLLLLPTTTTSTTSVVLAFSGGGGSSSVIHQALLSSRIISSRPTSSNSRSSPISSSSSSFRRPFSFQQQQFISNNIINNNKRSSTTTTTTSLNLLGSDSGLLGVGAPEVAVILLVGYFILGPSDLYKLVKEIGKFIQNARTLGAEAAKSFEGTMEDQLELKELRRAQSELNEAFGFRRSINTSEFGEAFDRTAGATAATASAAAAATTGGSSSSSSSNSDSEKMVGGEDEGNDAPKRKRRLVRRKKKKVEDFIDEIDVPSSSSSSAEGENKNNFALEYPDLDMLDSVVDDDLLLRAQRMERLQQSDASTTTAPSNQEKDKEGIMDWFTASDEDIASKILNQPDNAGTTTNNIINSFEKQRFQSQLSAEEWNAQIMAREDELSPLSMVMQRLAILDEEKRAADKRIEEEYLRRLDNEDKYYLEKRNVLLEAITDIQEGVYGNNNVAGGGSDEYEEEKDRVEKDKGEGESSSSISAKVGEDDDHYNDDDGDDDAPVKEEINANKKMAA